MAGEPPDGFYELFDAVGNTYEKGCIEIKCPAKRKSERQANVLLRPSNVHGDGVFG